MILPRVPRCKTHGVEVSFEGEFCHKCWALVRLDRGPLSKKNLAMWTIYVLGAWAIIAAVIWGVW